MDSRIPGLKAVLFDRDGTLIVDAPAPRDPRDVRTMPTAREAVRRAREDGLRIAVVTNQPALGRGVDAPANLLAVHREVEQQLGRFDVWAVCPHAEDEGCDCRKPRPGLVLEAAARLGLAPAEVAVVGDTAADVAAAREAGARGVLVPNAATDPREVLAAPLVARTVLEAIELLETTPSRLLVGSRA